MFGHDLWGIREESPELLHFLLFQPSLPYPWIIPGQFMSKVGNFLTKGLRWTHLFAVLSIFSTSWNEQVEVPIILLAVGISTSCFTYILMATKMWNSYLQCLYYVGWVNSDLLIKFLMVIFCVNKFNILSRHLINYN